MADIDLNDLQAVRQRIRQLDALLPDPGKSTDEKMALMRERSELDARERKLHLGGKRAPRPNVAPAEPPAADGFDFGLGSALTSIGKIPSALSGAFQAFGERFHGGPVVGPMQGPPAPAATPAPAEAAPATPTAAAPRSGPVQGTQEVTHGELYDQPQVPAAMADKRPLDQGNPEDDLVRRLTEAVLAPHQGVPQRRPMTMGEHMALGLIGALDPNAFEKVVIPIIESERNAPRQAALDQEAVRQREISAIQALASLQGVQEQRRATRAIEEQRIGLTQAGMAQKESLFERSEADKMERLRVGAKLRADAAKVPTTIASNYALMVPALANLTAAKKLMDENYSTLLGGEVGGPMSSKFTVGFGADVRSQVSAKLNQANDALLMLSKRRGVPGGEGLLKITDSLPEIGMSGPRLRASVETALHTLQTIMDIHHKLYPQLLGLGVGAGAPAGPPPSPDQYPGFEANDTDLGFILNDSVIP